MQNQQLLSIVVPLYNEEQVLELFYNRLLRVLENCGMAYEIIFIDDGSSDSSLQKLTNIKQSNPNVGILELSRNFGKEIALSAGLDHASGDAIVVIDADLQDPPELIPELINKWHQGFDVVYAQRKSRHGETWLKKITAHAFYRLMAKISRVQIPVDTGDFRLINKKALQALQKCREQHRFMKGLFAWVGYKQTAVSYERAPRAAGHTKWHYINLWNLALEGITSYSTVPLKLSMYFGFLIAFLAFLYASYIVYKTLIFGEAVRGYPSLMVVILFMGGVQLFSLGVLGEYLGRMFNESKQRPLYLLNNWQNPQTTATYLLTSESCNLTK